MMPVVSVVIPHFNRADLLRETLISLQNQTIENWEAIVVDDDSSDDQWDQIQHFDDERVRFLQRNDGIKGPSRCRNLGVQASTGKYVMFVDSDDLVAPWALAQRVNQMEQQSDSEYIVFPVMLFNGIPGDLNLMWNTLDTASEPSEDLDRFLRSDPPWHTSSPLWRRESLVKLGGFNENVMYGDDSDLHCRALLANITYSTAHDAMPDAFVRRAGDDRITNRISAKLLDSRFTRLSEGSKLVTERGAQSQQQVWEGQYFMECEYLLFNVDDSRPQRNRVLQLWRQRHHPSLVKQCVIGSYFAIASMCRNRFYLGLRLARRLAAIVLPDSFFAKPSGFESTQLSGKNYRELCSRLGMTS